MTWYDVAIFEFIVICLLLEFVQPGELASVSFTNTSTGQQLVSPIDLEKGLLLSPLLNAQVPESIRAQIVQVMSAHVARGPIPTP
jgi:hypothetical protein